MNEKINRSVEEIVMAPIWLLTYLEQVNVGKGGRQVKKDQQRYIAE